MHWSRPRWRIAAATLLFFCSTLACPELFPAGEGKTAAEAAHETVEEQPPPAVHEKPAVQAKKKKFPLLPVVLGVAAAATLTYLLLRKKAHYTLTVTVAAGVTGSPAAGSGTRRKGEIVTYSYALQAGYKNLVVTLDGAAIGASGTVVMNGSHTLAATAAPLASYTLAVNKGSGVTGAPESGSYAHAEGATVAWSYALQEGYRDLQVALDGAAVGASGSVTMNGDHVLAVTAVSVPIEYYTLFVTRQSGVEGTPASGEYRYAAGTTVAWDYRARSGYGFLSVKLGGRDVPAGGSVVMNSNHTLVATAVKVPSLTVAYPNGGENIMMLEPAWPTIRWSSAGVSGPVKIEFIREATGSGWTIVESTANDGTYLWDPFMPGGEGDGRIRISSVDDPTVFDLSNAPFTLHNL